MAEGGFDFDPLTEEGKTDINKDIEENYTDYEESLFTDPSGRNLFGRFNRFGKGVRYAWDVFRNIFKQQNPYKKLPEYMELTDFNNVDADKKFAAVLTTEIEKLFPEYIEHDYKNVLKYFRLNSDGVLEMYDPLNKNGKELNSDESKIPRALKRKMGWSNQHIMRYKYAKEKLDSWFEDNHISRENGYDLFDDNGIMKIKGPNDTKFRRLHTNSGDFYTETYRGAVSTLTNQIKTDLGPSNFDKRQEAEQAVWNVREKVKQIKIKKGKLEQEHQANLEELDAILDESIGKNIDTPHDEQEELHRRLALLKERNEKIPDMVRELANKEHEFMQVIDENLDIRRRLDRLKVNDEELYASRQRLDNDEHELDQEIDGHEEEIERINERLPLRERIKEIIKKYGLTVTGIGLSVGVIIGVIINSLKSGLTSSLKVLGMGLKLLVRS